MKSFGRAVTSGAWMCGIAASGTASADGADMSTLAQQIRPCWAPARQLADETAKMTIRVAFDLAPDGRVVPASIRQLSAAGPDTHSSLVNFMAARSAIAICGKTPFTLPLELAGEMRTVEMTFDAERNQIR